MMKIESIKVAFSDIYGHGEFIAPSGYEFTGRLIDTKHAPLNTCILSDQSTPLASVLACTNVSSNGIRAELRKLPEPKPAPPQVLVYEHSERRPPQKGEMYLMDGNLFKAPGDLICPQDIYRLVHPKG
jgi:hypothetical protein